MCIRDRCGNIQSCQALKSLGYRVTQCEFDVFRATELSCSRAVVDGERLANLVTAEKPILTSLPVGTKWLVLHGLLNISSAASMPGTQLREADVGVEITCYGGMGTVLEGMAPGAHNFDHRIAGFTTVMDWIARNAKSSIGTRKTRLVLSASWRRSSEPNFNITREECATK